MDIFDALAGNSEQQSENDIFSELAKKKQFPWSAKGKVHSAYKAIKEKPNLIGSVFPKALEQYGENIFALHDPITSSISNLLGKSEQDQGLGKIVSERLSGDLPEHLQRGAQDIADVEEQLLNLLPVPKIGKAISPKGLSKSFPIAQRKTAQTFPSGISKSRAVQAKHPERGIITPERKIQTLRNLDEEAKSLTKKSLHKNVPLVKRIEQGFDFEKHFEKGFGELKKSAEKFNPDIDIRPLSSFLGETRMKYRGIPKLHSDAIKIQSELKAISKRPAGDLTDLLKIRRSNSQKIKHIYETSRLTGKQQEYVDFLNGFNKRIDESIEKTLPKESEWFNNFKNTNKEYGDYIKAKETINMLDSALGEKFNADSFKKLATNKKKQDRLKLKMGESGANEVIQIAGDLKLAQEAIQKIPAKDLKLWEKILPLAFFSPVGKIIGAAKFYNYSKRLYGWFLTTPAKRKAFDKALQAISKNDINAYKAASQQLTSD